MAELTVAASSTEMTLLNADTENQIKLYQGGGRIQRFTGYYKNESGGALAADSIVQLCKIPEGRVLPGSKFTFTAFGASRTMDVGLQEYTNNEGTVVASDIDAFIDGVDVSSAGNTTVDALTANMQGVHVNGQAVVLAKVIGADFPTNAEIFFDIQMVVGAA